MVDYKYADLFKKDSVDKQMQIAFDGGIITNAELHSQQFELNESLCSDNQLRFGSCEASSIKFKISNIFTPLKDKWLTVSETLDGNTDEPFLLGKYKVDSEKPTADRRYREVTAYDAMYDIVSAEVSDWYNTILPNADSAVTLKQFRDSFLAYFGIEQEAVELINDSMTVEKTVEPSEMSGQTVITAICEINGCFGHIGRDGKFHYVFLEELVEGLYPADTLYPRDDLYPADPMNSEKINRSHYINAEYEDFKTERINKLQIRQEENDIGCIYGDGDNCYIVQDNFLVYGKSAEELNTIAANLYSVICKVWYRPAHVEAKGNPCLEVGDGIRLCTTREIIYTYILQRTLKGIQALRDTYDAEGEQYQAEKVNSVQNSIIQLKGKTNVLTRTIEETRLEIKDIESGLSSRITQNANSITAEVERAQGQEVELAAAISINADSITAEVTRATAAEGTLSSKITQNAEQIQLKVSKNNIISEINQTAEKITISAQKIDLQGIVNADELVSKFATIATLNSTKATLNDLIATKASIETLNATKASLENLIATKATVTALNASNARIRSLEVDHVSINDFNATTANLQNLIAQKIDASTVKADYMEVVNWTSAGYIKADRIDADKIFARASSSTSMRVGVLQTDFLDINSEFTLFGQTGNIQYIASIGRSVLVFD